MEAGNQNEATPAGGKRSQGPRSPKTVATQTSLSWGLQSMHTKKTTHTHPHRLKPLRSHDPRPGALKLGPWQSKATGAPVGSDQQPIRGWGGHFGGSGHLLDWLSPCCSSICPPTPHGAATSLPFTVIWHPPLYLPLPGGTKHMPAVWKPQRRASIARVTARGPERSPEIRQTHGGAKCFDNEKHTLLVRREKAENNPGKEESMLLYTKKLNNKQFSAWINTIQQIFPRGL